MKNKHKNRLLLFCFSLLPGAGEMYLGFMKQGVSLMSVFFAAIAVSTWLDLGPFLFLLPVIWFYSFFHVHNLRQLPDDEFYFIKDDFLLGLNDLSSLPGILNKYSTWIAVLLILVGVTVLWNTFLDTLYYIFPTQFFNTYYQIAHLLPRLASGILIIFLGLYFIRGKKSSLNHEDRPTYLDDGKQNDHP